MVATFKFESLLVERLEVFLAVCNVIVIVTALVGNVLMCISVIRLLKKKVPSNIFILSLVLSDLGLCIFQLPIVISSLLNQRTYVLDASGMVGKIVCNLSGVIYFIVRQVSFFAIMAIAVDRYGALHFPLKYKTMFTYNRACVATGVSWIVCITIALIPYFYWIPYIYSPVFLYCMWDITNPALKQYVFMVFVPTFAISNIVLGFTSIANVVRLQQLSKKGRARRLRSADSLGRASRTALIVVLAFTICYLPRYLLVFFILPADSGSMTCFWFYYRSISEMLIYINSAINPLIYIFRSKQFINEIALLCNIRSCEHANGTYQSIPLTAIATKTSKFFNRVERSSSVHACKLSEVSEKSEL